MSITLPSPTTVPDLLAGLLNRTPCSAALSWRESGYWRRLATEEIAREVRRCALGLIKLGVKSGDCVGLLAPSSPHWVIADLAIMSIGAISVPLFSGGAPSMRRPIPRVPSASIPEQSPARKNPCVAT